MNPDEFIKWMTVTMAGMGVFITVLTCVITAVCVGVPFGLLGWYLLKRRDQANALRQAAQSWLTTTGVVIKSRVEVTSGGETTSVNPYVLYTYTVNGQLYQGQEIRAGDKFMRIQSGRDAYITIDRYPEGASVTVYYNPANPAEAALER